METTVLIVDDHEGFRGTARRLLECAGYTVVGEAATGADAVEAALRLDPDLILLDVQLPDIDGFAVAERIRAAGGRQAVVFFSSRDASDYGTRVEDSAAAGYVGKGDLSPERLAELLGRG
jgi:DNA-binding NarL/FixJ family response regulator